jgi:anaerobic ribonucleoside-triphosphate reductase
MSDRVQKSVSADGQKLVVPCEVYSRIVGYLRPVQAWNDGKQQEFKERQTFELAPQGGEDLD